MVTCILCKKKTSKLVPANSVGYGWLCESCFDKRLTLKKAVELSLNK